MIQFKTTYTTQDYVDMQVKLQTLTGDLNNLKKRSTISLMLIVIILSWTFDLFSSLFGGIAAVLMIIAAGLIMPNLLEKTAVKNFNKQLSGRNMENSLGTVEFEVNEEGIIRKMQYSTLAFDWDGVIRIGEDDRNYYLFLSRTHVLFFPKQPEGLSEADQLRFESLIGQVRKRIREEYQQSRDASQ
ncbi:YcxB family protein [Jeotgalibacillus haloalkalitolerans]|uniref:YcxB family protein n=1 Tax=Jeotgalibacillus haloalkalitolerans TaxID=3104292 RepID=A0ABU5KHP9_9BACL|nr:YcxB family protein [Jeotgalibacillus sp. HH7-29]MDZ5710695.1 YcxB family protein [Jeotgalibacillus sp. HH7-29]